MTGSSDPEILNIDEAAALLGVSVKTFNRVLHEYEVPARKIGREWKFSRRALIEWVGAGRSSEYYREPARGDEDVLVPLRARETADRGERNGRPERPEPAGARRTSGWDLRPD